MFHVLVGSILIWNFISRYLNMIHRMYSKLPMSENKNSQAPTPGFLSLHCRMKSKDLAATRVPPPFSDREIVLFCSESHPFPNLRLLVGVPWGCKGKEQILTSAFVPCTCPLRPSDMVLLGSAWTEKHMWRSTSIGLNLLDLELGYVPS